MPVMPVAVHTALSTLPVATAKAQSAPIPQIILSQSVQSSLPAVQTASSLPPIAAMQHPLAIARPVPEVHPIVAPAKSFFAARSVVPSIGTVPVSTPFASVNHASVPSVAVSPASVPPIAVPPVAISSTFVPAAPATPAIFKPDVVPAMKASAPVPETTPKPVPAQATNKAVVPAMPVLQTNMVELPISTTPVSVPPAVVAAPKATAETPVAPIDGALTVVTSSFAANGGTIHTEASRQNALLPRCGNEFPTIAYYFIVII